MLASGLFLFLVLVAAAPDTFVEDWSDYQTGAPLPQQSPDGNWITQFNGFGTVSVVADSEFGRALELSPKRSVYASETHAALVTSLASFMDVDARVSLRTIARLRAHAPNPAEVGWVLWHYQDHLHFYYFILKPNGWELGKEDPSFDRDQRPLATGPEPKLTIGKPEAIRIVQRSATIWAYVGERNVVVFTDNDRPYLIGSVGLYCEDSVVRFGRTQLTALPPSL